MCSHGAAGSRSPQSQKAQCRSYADPCPLAEPNRSLLLIVGRKLLTPSNFSDLGAPRRGLMAFQYRYHRVAKPFKWTFTRRDLHILIAKLRSHNAS